jgi:hypothetical protein
MLAVKSIISELLTGLVEEQTREKNRLQK